MLGIHCDKAYVIVTYNSARYISKCILSIKSYDPDAAIIVVDNASSDDSLMILSEIAAACCNLLVVSLDKNVGFGSAHNIAFFLVKARYYVLINQDAWLAANTISPALMLMERHASVAICGLPLIFPNGAPQTYAYAFSSWRKWLLQLLGAHRAARLFFHIPGLARLLLHLPMAREYIQSQMRSSAALTDGVVPPSLRQVDWVCGAAVILRGRFIEEMGGFDPAIFLYGEDEDICLKASRAGWMVAVAEVPPVVHVFGWGQNKFNPVVAHLKYRSLQYFIQKNINSKFSRKIMLFLLPLHVYGLRRLLHAVAGK